MCSKLQVRKGFFVAVVIAALCVFTSAGDAKIYRNPFITWPKPFTVCYLPFYNEGKLPLKREFQYTIIDELIKKSESYYTFEVTTYDETINIYKNWFVKSAENNKKRIEKKSPSQKYWKTSDYNFLVYGSYKIDKKKIIIEYFVYDVKEWALLEGKRYEGDLNETEEIQQKIIISILENLKKREEQYKFDSFWKSE